MKIRVVLASIGLICPLIAQAQTSDPVDKNVGGAFIGALASIGQAKKVGDVSPGTAYLIGGEAGFVIKRDTWNRLELGIEVSTGQASYKDKDSKFDADVDLKLVTMVKAGYGYSLGEHAFGIFRLGVGIAQADIEGKPDVGATMDGGSSSGLVTKLAWDVVSPATDTLDFTFGVSYTIMKFNFKDLPGDTGEVQLNVPAVYAGARVRL